MIKKIIALFLILIPINSYALIEVDITRGNLNPLPVAVSPLSIDEKSRKNFENVLKKENIGEEISEPIFFFFKILSKFCFDTLSIDKGETAIGSGFKFPLVISTSINAKEFVGINNIKNKVKYLFIKVY